MWELPNTALNFQIRGDAVCEWGKNRDENTGYTEFCAGVASHTSSQLPRVPHLAKLVLHFSLVPPWWLALEEKKPDSSCQVTHSAGLMCGGGGSGVSEQPDCCCR